MLNLPCNCHCHCHRFKCCSRRQRSSPLKTGCPQRSVEGRRGEGGRRRGGPGTPDSHPRLRGARAWCVQPGAGAVHARGHAVCCRGTQPAVARPRLRRCLPGRPPARPGRVRRGAQREGLGCATKTKPMCPSAGRQAGWPAWLRLLRGKGTSATPGLQGVPHAGTARTLRAHTQPVTNLSLAVPPRQLYHLYRMYRLYRRHDRCWTCARCCLGTARPSARRSPRPVVCWSGAPKATQ